MLRIRLVVVLLAATLAAAAFAAPASGAAPRSAERFADAALRAKERLRALVPEIERRFAETDLGTCERASEDAPERAQRVADALFVLGALQPVIVPTTPVFERLLADLEAIPTRDPALRSGRAAWRTAVADLRRLPAFDRPCEALRRWADADYAPAATPPVPVAEIERLTDESANAGFERQMRRAERRLRRLGISRAAARRFTGETLFDGVVDEVVLGD